MTHSTPSPPSFSASLALPELIVHSVFTHKQWKNNTNKKPTSPYTDPAMLGHLATTSLAKSLVGVPRAAGKEEEEPASPKGSGLPRRTAPATPQQAVPSRQGSAACVREGGSLQVESTRRL